MTKEKLSLLRRIFCGNGLRLLIILCIAITTGLHITLIVVPNWWKFNFEKLQTAEAAISGITILHGGLWRLCQQFGEDASLYLLETRTQSCYNYGQYGNDLHRIGEVTHVDGWHVPRTKACMIISVSLNFVNLILVAVACRIKSKRCPMMTVFLFQFAQCMLIVAAVVTAHNWIRAGSWRDFNDYDWAFWWTCYIIAPYFFISLMSMWSGCTANAGRNTQEDSETDTESYVARDTFDTRDREVKRGVELETREQDFSKPPIVSIDGVDSAEV